MLIVVAELEFAEASAEVTAPLGVELELFEVKLQLIVLMPLPPSFVRLET